jgi:hypothetical protein
MCKLTVRVLEPELDLDLGLGLGLGLVWVGGCCSQRLGRVAWVCGGILHTGREVEAGVVWSDGPPLVGTGLRHGVAKHQVSAQHDGRTPGGL